jgi:hypothetical protein
MASDEKVIDGCMCCIDRLKWQAFTAALVDTSSTMENGHEIFVIPVR